MCECRCNYQPGQLRAMVHFAHVALLMNITNWPAYSLGDDQALCAAQNIVSSRHRQTMENVTTVLKYKLTIGQLTTIGKSQSAGNFVLRRRLMMPPVSFYWYYHWFQQLNSKCVPHSSFNAQYWIVGRNGIVLGFVAPRMNNQTNHKADCSFGYCHTQHRFIKAVSK